MLRRALALLALGSSLMALAPPPPAPAPAAPPAAAPSGMIKFASIWEQPGDNAALDRWYRTTHSRESLLFVGPWLRRYWAYRGYDVPKAADAVGASRYRLTEMWYGSAAEMQDAQRAWYPLSPPPRLLADPARTRIAQIYVPAVPDERFKDGWPRERADYFRWVFFMRDPPDVDPAKAEAWFADGFAKPLAARPEVSRFTCARAVSTGSPPRPDAWRRMCEVWFDDYEGFRRAVLEGPHAAPPWSAAFPYVPMISIFTAQTPDMDFLRDDYRAP